MGYAYGTALLVMGVLDALWLGYIARDFYREGMGTLMAPEIHKLAAAAFYFGYPAGLVLLVFQPTPESVSMAAWRSALVGLVAYGTYDLTNLATLRNYSSLLAFSDMAWGTFASAVAGTAAFYVVKRFAM